MIYETSIESLLAFGFTETEARIYCFLLEESPATGYRISHAIGKAAANTYKAIAALEAKGALVIENGETRLCRATPPEDLLALLSRQFDAKKAMAKESLSRIHAPSEDHRVYQLTTADQVFARARAMLDSAKQIVTIDLTPLMADRFAKDVAEVEQRGVQLAAITYRPHDAYDNDFSALSANGERVLAAWPGQQINLVVDGRETLLAFLSRDCTTVIQAVWTNSRYLSVLYFNSIAAEIQAHRFERLAMENNWPLDATPFISLSKTRPLGMQELLSDPRIGS